MNDITLRVNCSALASAVAEAVFPQAARRSGRLPVVTAWFHATRGVASRRCVTLRVITAWFHATRGRYVTLRVNCVALASAVEEAVFPQAARRSGRLPVVTAWFHATRGVASRRCVTLWVIRARFSAVRGRCVALRGHCVALASAVAEAVFPQAARRSGRLLVVTAWFHATRGVASRRCAPLRVVTAWFHATRGRCVLLQVFDIPIP